MCGEIYPSNSCSHGAGNTAGKGLNLRGNFFVNNWMEDFRQSAGLNIVYRISIINYVLFPEVEKSFYFRPGRFSRHRGLINNPQFSVFDIKLDVSDFTVADFKLFSDCREFVQICFAYPGNLLTFGGGRIKGIGEIFSGNRILTGNRVPGCEAAEETVLAVVTECHSLNENG